MRFIRFLDSVNQVHVGVDQGDGTALRVQGDLFANHTVTHQKIAVKKLLAPLQPAAILCIGLNYRKHAEETGATVDWECELAIVIGKKCKNATKANALDHVLGYTCANDVSARDWQRQKKLGGGSPA